MIEKLKQNITELFQIASRMIFDIAFLKDELKKMQDNLSNYEAIGILDGNPLYFEKLEDKRARVERLKAIVNFIDILIKTDDKIMKEENTLKEV
jgi:hypothetical protein